MKDEPRRLLEKAARAIEAARVLASRGPEFAAGRAYYSMFYTARALLAENDIRRRKHSAVHAAFGEHFAKGAILDPKFHRWLIDAFAARIEDDYGIFDVVTAADADLWTDRAAEFLAVARRYLSGGVT